jgi:uncharacterized protein (DUF433 family)
MSAGTANGSGYEQERSHAGDVDLLTSGALSIQDTADLLGVKSRLVRAWLAGVRGKQLPVISAELGKVDDRLAVSFTNLMELRFVAEFHKAGVRLSEIRAILDEAKDFLNHPHPAATQKFFRTDGHKILGEIGRKHGVEVLYDLRTRNFEMPAIVLPSLKQDVVFDPDGNIVQWFPRRSIAPNVIVDPRFSFGRPIMRQSYIPAATLADAVESEGSAEAVAEIFDVSEQQVEEAVRFCNSLQQAA